MFSIDKIYENFEFKPDTKPCAFADSGEVVRFICKDCYADQLTDDNIDFTQMNMTHNNPITGPLYINDAQPGDVLKVELQNIEIADFASMCVRTGVGTYEVEGCHCRRFPIENGIVKFDNNIEIPIKPMVGVMGTSPASGAASTQSPGEHGGNMDIRELGVGSIIYFPVNVPGALLSMGDIHAVQGDGETAICAMEVSGAVTVKVEVVKGDKFIPTPFIVTPKSYYTTASAKSLDECSVAAARKMHRFVMEYANMDDGQAAMLLSVVGHLRISQVVNPEKGCIMELPRAFVDLGDLL